MWKTTVKPIFFCKMWQCFSDVFQVLRKKSWFLEIFRKPFNIFLSCFACSRVLRHFLLKSWEKVSFFCKAFRTIFFGNFISLTPNFFCFIERDGRIDRICEKVCEVENFPISWKKVPIYVFIGKISSFHMVWKLALIGPDK